MPVEDDVYRRRVGENWALLGDAGHFKGPVTAQEMTDALLDAELLAGGLVQVLAGNMPLAEALARFGRLRDLRSAPMHRLTGDLAGLRRPRRPSSLPWPRSGTTLPA